jgi:hypothetical protein
VPYDDGFKEDFVEILPVEALKVFNQKNPRPDNALQGDEAVMNYLGIEIE